MAPPIDPKFAVQLPDILQLLHWRIPDPGPPWYQHLLSQEGQVAVATAQLQMQKAILTAYGSLIDANINALNKSAAGKERT